MLKLAEKYAARPAAELPLLFQRILQNAIRDFFRRQKVRSAWTTLLVRPRPDRRGRRCRIPWRTLRSRSTSACPTRRPTSWSSRKSLQSLKKRSKRCRHVNVRPSCCVIGRTWMSRNRQGHGMLGGQRQNALLPGDACIGENPEIKRRNAMNEKEFGKETPALAGAFGGRGRGNAGHPAAFGAAARPGCLPGAGAAVRFPDHRARHGPDDQVLRPAAGAAVAAAGDPPRHADRCGSCSPNVDIGELDAQLLTGELPIDAFLDEDFDQWLKSASGSF